MLKGSKISRYRILKVIDCYCLDLEASKTAVLLKLNRNTVNRYYGIFRRRDANKPDTLYRYRPLNKEVLEREFQNIERQQVWMTQPCYANDPFDSSFSLAYEAYVLPREAKEQVVSRFELSLGNKLDQTEIAELANMFQISKERFRYLFRKAFPDEPIQAADAILEAFRTTAQNVNRGQVQELNEFTKQNLSVCCFCERRDSILMWTHYADQHRGCCIEFEVSSHFIPDGVGPLLPVLYKDEPFDVTPYYTAIAAGGGNNWAAMLAACHKRKAWAYELEWRLVFPFAMPNGRGNHHIPIRSITVGLRVQEDVERRLFEIAQRLHVPLYRTSQSYLESSLHFELVTAPR